MTGMSVQRAVLDATLGIIATDGPDAVSMREVARRAGVSHQAPYHHFGDRAGIFAAIAAEGFTTLATKLRAVMADAANPSQRCLEAYVAVALEYPGHFRVMFRSDLCGVSTNPTTAAAADAALAELQRMVERIIGTPSDSGAAFVWASALWSCAHGLATLLLDGPLRQELPPGVALDDHIGAVAALLGDMVDRQAAASGFHPYDPGR
jgi:AcrR family transcriptional regulator